jgi:hypothetical protein
MYLTCGSLRGLQAFFWLRVFSTSQTLSTPAHMQITQIVNPLFSLGAKSKNGCVD